MSIVLRQVLLGIGMALVSFYRCHKWYFYLFSTFNWSELWGRGAFDTPFILLIPSVSIVIGILFGIISGYYWRKQLQSVDGWLHQIEEGRPLEMESTSLPEIRVISNRISKIQKQITEQAKLSQRLATEAAEDQETRMQEMIFQERNRLARELHDSVSQQLFAASMLMSAINEVKTPSDDWETKQLKMVEEMIHQSQLEMRALLLHLRPVALKGKTLQEGIKELLV